MRHQLYLLILLISISFGCKPSIEKPSNLISETQMVNILYDLYVLNGAKGINSKTLVENNLNPKKLLLAKYSIDSLQFATSNAYYTFNNEIYTDILEKVKAKIEVNKTQYDTLLKLEDLKMKREKESLKVNVTPELKNKTLEPIKINTPK